MVKTKQISIRMPEIEAKRLQQLSDNSGLSKAILVKLMLSATLRDLKNEKKTESRYLLCAWTSKQPLDLVEGIYVY